MEEDSVRNGVPVMERTVSLLDLLERYPAGATIRNLTRELDLPRSTVYRILNTLLAHKWVRRTNDGVFSLGPRLTTLAARVKSDVASYDLAEIATPVAQQRLDVCFGDALQHVGLPWVKRPARRTPHGLLLGQARPGVSPV